MTKTYNGHKNWNHWNVSLWINNDDTLYFTAIDCIRSTNSRDAAVRAFAAYAPEKTSDGAPYSLSAIRAAMVGMEA